jgi:hypothetical protein
MGLLGAVEWQQGINKERSFHSHVEGLNDAGDQGDWIPKNVWQGGVSAQLGGNDP